jgi:hypothetical protein
MFWNLRVVLEEACKYMEVKEYNKSSKASKMRKNNNYKKRIKGGV